MTVEQESPDRVTFTRPSDLEFSVERVFDAPIERVWATYTDPTLIPQWWGQGTTVDRLDLLVGGIWRFVSNPGTEQEFAISGEYLEVVPPTRLVQTFLMEGPHSKPCTQTIEFEPVAGGTRLSVTSRFDTTEERDAVVAYGVVKGARAGWANLDALLKKLAAA